jgi:hypothetical protein
VPRVPNAADAAPRPAPASAPVALPVAAGAGGPPPVTGADQGGIDSLFNSHELWKGVAMPTKVETPAAKRPTARRTLLDEAEVEGALKLFDDAASQDPAPKEPDGS